MRQNQERLEALGVSVAVVTFQSGYLVDQYIRDTGVSWPIMPDKSLELYTAYGMGRGGWWNIWEPATWGAYLKLLFLGRRLAKTSADVNQLGGDVLIDPQGIVRLHHVGKGPADRPTVGELINVVQQCNTNRRRDP